MKHALDMLADMPGVKHVMLVTEDGVPIAMSAPRGAATEDEELEQIDGHPKLGIEDALAGLAVGLLTDLSIAVGQMSWKEPRRVVLRAARGTLVMQGMTGAVLMVLMARGLRAEELRLSMDGTIARIERSLRDMGSTDEHADGESGPFDVEPSNETPGPLPSQEEYGSGLRLKTTTEQGEQGSSQ